MRPNSQQLSSIVRPALVVFGCWLSPLIASAQSDEELDTLIFDPVFLNGGQPENIEGPMVTAQARLAGLTILADPPEAAAQSDTDLPGTGVADIAAYERQVTELERSEGLFAPGLIQNLLALGQIYQAQGKHELAVAMLERADYISRINHGLYDPGQIPIVENLIKSYLALNDFAMVSDKQRYLMFLNQKLQHTGTLASVPFLAGMGDGNMHTLDQALLVADPPNKGPVFNAGGMDTPGQSEIARFYALSSLSRARNTYSAAISTLIENRNFQHPRLLELEYKYLETLFLAGFSQELIFNPHYYMTSARRTANMPNRWNHLRRNPDGYEAGKKSFERILLYLEENSSTTAVERVRARLEFADWHLVFGWGDSAAEEYGRAYALALALGLDRDTMADLFSPGYALQLPLFTPKPNSREKFGVSRDAELAFDGYIDMNFAISKNGTARKIQVVDKTTNTTYAIEDRLKRYLRNSPFRPHIAEGAPVSRDDVTMRYYYTFQ